MSRGILVNVPISQTRRYQCTKCLKQTCLQAQLNHFFTTTLQRGFKDIKGLLDLICPHKAIFQDFHSASIFANML